MPKLFFISIYLLLFSSDANFHFPVIFPDAGPLGIQFDSSLHVVGFARKQDGTTLPAESSRWLRHGDILESINGENVRGLALSDVTSIVAKAKVPRTLTFSTTSDRVAEMSATLDGPVGIHGHSGLLELTSKTGGTMLGSIPFLQAGFGGQLSCTSSPLFAPQPRFGCGAYTSTSNDAIRGSIVVVERGGCTFSDKAAIAQAAGAVGLIVLNQKGNSFVRMPIDVSEASRHDLTLAVVMIDFGPGAEMLRSLLKIKTGVAENGVDVTTVASASGRAGKELIGTKSDRFRAQQQQQQQQQPLVFVDLEGRLVPKGLECKPWRLATTALLENERQKRAQIIADATIAAKAGTLYIFPPASRVGGGGDGSLMMKGESITEEKNTGNGDVHTFENEIDGTFSHNERAGFESLDRATRSLSGGTRARRALDGVNSASRVEAAAADASISSTGEIIYTNNFNNGKGGASIGSVNDGSIDSVSGVIDMAAEELRARVGSSDKTEYLRADFGGPPPNYRLRLIRAVPFDLCSSLIGIKSLYKDSAILVTRGGCTFTEKSKRAKAAGAKVLIVISNSEYAFSMPYGVDGDAKYDDIKSKEDLIPSIMVTHAGGLALNAAIDAAIVAFSFSASGIVASGGGGSTPLSHVKLQPLDPSSWRDASIYLHSDSSINDAWKELDGLLDPKAWPNDIMARKKIYTRMARYNHPDRIGGSQERFELLAFLYRRANNHYAPDTETPFEEAGRDVPLRAGG